MKITRKTFEEVVDKQLICTHHPCQGCDCEERKKKIIDKFWELHTSAKK